MPNVVPGKTPTPNSRTSRSTTAIASSGCRSARADRRRPWPAERGKSRRPRRAVQGRRAHRRPAPPPAAANSRAPPPRPPQAASCETTRADQDRVLRFPHRRQERLGHHHVADSPTGKAIGLRERDRARSCAGRRRGASRAKSAGAVVDEIFVGLVADVIDAALAAQLVDRRQRRLGVDRARWGCSARW